MISPAQRGDWRHCPSLTCSDASPMIDRFSQVEVRRPRRFDGGSARRLVWAAALVAWSLLVTSLSAVHAQMPEARKPGSAVDTHRLEGDAVLALADAAMAGQKPVTSPDLTLGWQNAFLKAQQGTFVPFTLAVNTTGVLPDAVLVYVRAVKRGTPAGTSAAVARGRRAERTPERAPGEIAADTSYPVDAIFPVEL